MSMGISVLVTASGFIGLAVTILSFFFEIKPAQKNAFRLLKCVW